MHWYGGSIAEAVTLSKQKNAIFVVFVEGDNDLSTEMAATIDESSVVSRLSDQSNFLAVKLKSGTVNYTHFAQIYQFVPVPSLFFIGRNGTPLEVVCAGVEAPNLATRIDRILAEHHKGKAPSVQPSMSSSALKEQTTSLLQSEAASNVPTANDIAVPKDDPQPKLAPAPQSNANAADSKPESSSPSPPKIAKKEDSEDHEIVCVGDVCVRRPKGAADQPSTSQASTPVKDNEPASGPAEDTASSDSIEDKMERAKELIEARRREKAEKEKELERQKELERRTTGQGVAELKRWQAEQELKQIQEERKREKMENNLARQRILEQIAQDRAERKARDLPAPSPVPTATPASAQPAPHATSGDASTNARIQFKLPDGTSHTANFVASGTLAEVQRYVADNLQLSASKFALWMAFPRRELTQLERTLRDLQLAPSAALLVLPRPAARPPPAFSVFAFITQLLTTLIYDPSLQLYTWIRARLFPPPAVSPRAASSPSAPVPPTTRATTPLRRRGNIHRLPGDAPDDDNNTWNGNSTQQM